ncbi:MAG: hypothetical protein GY716_10610 [bacterium]|nr:hypothetical protein [bacterium]
MIVSVFGSPGPQRVGIPSVAHAIAPGFPRDGGQGHRKSRILSPPCCHEKRRIFSLVPKSGGTLCVRDPDYFERSLVQKHATQVELVEQVGAERELSWTGVAGADRASCSKGRRSCAEGRVFFTVR